MRRLLLLLALLLIADATAAARPPLAAYGRLPGVELMRLSPSGQYYAFIAVLGERRRLGIASIDGRAIYASAIGDTKLRELRWACDDHLLVRISSTFKQPLVFRQAYELSAVVDIDLKTGQSKTIFGKTQGIANAVFGVYGATSIDGHCQGYFGGISYERGMTDEYYFAHGYPDLYRVDLDSGKPTLIDKGDERNDGWVVNADGSIAAQAEYDDEAGEWRLYRGKRREQLLIKRAAPYGDIALKGLGSQPGTVLVSDNTGAADQLLEVSLADGASQSRFDEWSVNGVLVDPLSGRLLGVDSDDEPGAYFLSPELQARFNGTRKAFPGLQMRLTSFSRDLDHLIVITDGGDDSGTYWLVDIASGQAKPIASAYPSIKAADVGVTRTFNYRAGDGLEIEAVLTLPPGRKPEHLPLVVMPHGGPIGVRDRIGFDWWAQAYANAGYAVLQPNYRGSSGYGRALRDAGNGQWGRKMLSDIADGVAALAAQQTIDAARVCIVGGSYGGYAALAGVSLQHGLYRCAVSVAGIADLSKFQAWLVVRYGYHSSALRSWKRATGSDQSGEQMLREISPARLAERADAPILLIHGQDDTVVPIEQSRIMEAALKDAHKPVESITMPGEDHWLSRETTRLAMLQAAVAFVQRYNPAD